MVRDFLSRNAKAVLAFALICGVITAHQLGIDLGAFGLDVKATFQAALTAVFGGLVVWAVRNR